MPGSFSTSVRSHPAFWTFSLFCFGIVVSDSIQLKPHIWFVLSGGFCVACLLTSSIPTSRLVSLRRLTASSAFALSIISLGAYQSVIDSRPDPTDIALWLHYPDLDETCISGQIVEEPRISEFSVRLVIEVDSARNATIWHRRKGRILVWRKPSPHVPDIGYQIITCGRLEPVPKRRNPADFDYGTYLNRQGIFSILRTTQDDDWIGISDEATFLEDTVRRARSFVSASIAQYITGQSGAAIVRSLLLGDRDQLSEDNVRFFRSTGLSHLLAISGLHVLLIGMGIYALSGPFLFRLKCSYRLAELLRSFLTMSTLVFYLQICGAAPSAVRAVVMAGIYLTGRVLQLRGNPVNSLGIAGLVLLCIDPSQLFEPGFQLSFSAVGGLLLLVDPIKQWISAKLRRVRGMRPVIGPFVVSLVAILSTAPVLSVHFGRVAFAGLLLNLVAIPLTALILLSGLIVVLTAVIPFLPPTLFGNAASLLADLLVLITQWGAIHMNWTSAAVFLRDSCHIIAYTTFLLSIAVQAGKKRWLLLVTLLVLSLSVWSHIVKQSDPAVLDMIALDVGHGDAIVLSLPDRRHMLVDAGQANDYTDQGLRTVLPHLTYSGIQKLDIVLVTHADNDHIGGAFSVLRTIPVSTLVLPNRRQPPEIVKKLVSLADSVETNVLFVGASDRLDLGPHVRAEVLSPSLLLVEMEDENDASIVLRITYGKTTLLLLGDVEVGAEDRLCREYGPLLKSDAVKVGHHGSRTSSLPCLVSHTNTGWAIISVGRSSIYGLPNEEVIERWHLSGASVHSTAEEGAVWLRSDGKRIEMVDWSRD